MLSHRSPPGLTFIPGCSAQAGQHASPAAQLALAWLPPVPLLPCLPLRAHRCIIPLVNWIASLCVYCSTPASTPLRPSCLRRTPHPRASASLGGRRSFPTPSGALPFFHSSPLAPSVCCPGPATSLRPLCQHRTHAPPHASHARMLQRHKRSREGTESSRGGGGMCAANERVQGRSMGGELGRLKFGRTAAAAAARSSSVCSMPRN